MNGFDYKLLRNSEMNIKKGDDGWSDLAGDGYRRRKDDDVFEAVGALDELSSSIGVIVALLSEDRFYPIHSTEFRKLKIIQSRLFDIGILIVTPERLRHKDNHNIPLVSEEDLAKLEEYIEKLEKDYKINTFSSPVLPGGTYLSSLIHQSRSICRRAERKCVGILLQSNGSMYVYNNRCIAYLNRLSDYLFLLSKKFNYDMYGNNFEYSWDRKN